MATPPVGVHVGSGLTAGNEVEDGGVLARAAEVDAAAVQVFLADPQDWGAPRPRPDAEALRAADLTVFVHAPYVLNVASTNNRIRIPSRKLLAQHASASAEIGAAGMVVHGGHVTGGDDPAAGVENWRKLFERQDDAGGFAVPVLIENTAGGDKAMARELGALARLWDAVGGSGAGFVLDTCHAWAAGWDLTTVVDDVRAITGRIDLVHLNDSRDEAGSTRDRHAPLGEGQIPLELLLDVARSASCPVVLETPGTGPTHAAEIAMVRKALQE